MRKRTAGLAAAVACTAAIAVGGIAVAAGDDGDEPVTGPEARAATRAALQATGGGTANAVERDSENGATWEVEVTKRDGQTVDVRLDQDYRVVVIEGDSEAADTDDGS
jgi:Peptidase propeptide and YPEB domain